MDLTEVASTVRTIFTFLMVTGGGALVYTIIDRTPLNNAPPKHKRLAAGALSALLSVIGYFGLMGLGVFPQPSCADGFWQQVWCWAEFPLNLMAWQFLVSQGIHLKDLPTV